MYRSGHHCFRFVRHCVIFLFISYKNNHFACMQLRVGDITPSQFLAGLNMAGLHKALSSAELQA